MKSSFEAIAFNKHEIAKALTLKFMKFGQVVKCVKCYENKKKNKPKNYCDDVN